jgi:demethylmenaquinone methyltransferase/2-methoxy-6-polyprenyl-1,4-benzoquinol methylase
MPSETVLAIAGFYDGISRFYGAANSFLTCGLDRYWRARAAGIAKISAPKALTALDACCGTGDFSLALKKAFCGRLKVTGTDLSAAMLAVAAKKYPDMEFTRSETEKLPFPDGSFDLVTISFAARNLNIGRGEMLAALRETGRVLRPGGIFLNLETTIPANAAVRFLMRIYVKTVTGLLIFVSPGSRAAYSFLQHTILNFHTAEEFSALLSEAGFAESGHKTLCPGAVAVHTAKKHPA